MIYPDDDLKPSADIDMSVFKCRYLKSRDSDAVQPVNGSRCVERALALSEWDDYSEAVLARLQPGGDGRASLMAGDVCLQALARLHVSVIPTVVPCREGEQGVITAFLTNFLKNQATHKSMYVYGMPGTSCSFPTCKLLCSFTVIESLLRNWENCNRYIIYSIHSGIVPCTNSN